ncbi:MAG TPA: TRAP transporter small permease [Synergistaceae bacterium]|jgi:TRAP-type C4-dicarboxylate transport system permease small subunit|nr:TRAP transporter small permease [Synergistaceae bacterium]
MMKGIRSVVTAGNYFLGYVSGLGILLMGLILCYEVVARFLFNAPTIWVQEVAVYLFMWTMLAGASYTLMLGKHVRIDLVFDRLPPKVQRAFDIVSSIIGMAFCGLVSVQAYDMIAASIRYQKVSATILRVPMWSIQLALLLGFVLLTFQFFFILLDRITEPENRKEGSGHD